MLRPIDVIFKHPVKKFTVIYHNGELWQLPRLAFTGKSLRLKRPYQGSREHIFVGSEQQLDADDVLLCSELITVNLPASIIGRNVNQFEAWWQSHWHEFQTQISEGKHRQQQAKQQLEQHSPLSADQAISITDEITTEITTQITTKATTDVPTTTQTALTKVPDSSTADPAAPKDIFDSMLEELLQNLP